MLPAYFINLDRHPERRSHIEQQIEEAGFSAERAPGIDGQNVPNDLAGYFDLEKTNRSALRPGQIGCHASHLRVMQIIVERNIAAALVLEDDTMIDDDAMQVIDEVMQRLPEDWDLVRMCRTAKRAVRPIDHLPSGRSLVRFSRIPVGRAGYLVSNRGARKLLTPRVMNCPGDVEISQAWRLNLQVYGVEPPPFRQERIAIPSSIGVNRGHRSMWKRALPDIKRLVFNMTQHGPYWWGKLALANFAQRLTGHKSALHPVDEAS